MPNLCCSRGGWDDVLGGATTSTPILEMTKTGMGFWVVKPPRNKEMLRQQKKNKENQQNLAILGDLFGMGKYGQVTSN